MNRLAATLRRRFSKRDSSEAEYGVKSYSQCGEDAIVDYIFKLREVARPSYIDIGAFHPFYLSNTALFHLRGSRGVNIEPNPAQFVMFEKERAADINLNVGIGARCELLPFYCMEDPTLSSFSKEEVNNLLLHGKKLEDTVELPLLTLSGIVNQHCDGMFPDFLTLDAEGMEIEVLSTVDFASSAPKVICVETAEYSPTGAGSKRRELMSFIEDRGYTLYADTNLNSIYVEHRFWSRP